MQENLDAYYWDKVNLTEVLAAMVLDPRCKAETLSEEELEGVVPHFRETLEKYSTDVNNEVAPGIIEPDIYDVALKKAKLEARSSKLEASAKSTPVSSVTPTTSNSSMSLATNTLDS